MKPKLPHAVLKSEQALSVLGTVAISMLDKPRRKQISAANTAIRAVGGHFSGLRTKMAYAKLTGKKIDLDAVLLDDLKPAS